MLKDRIKYLQTIKKNKYNIYWTEEIVKTFLYYNEIKEAKKYLKHFEFINNECNYLHMYINIFELLSSSYFNLINFIYNKDFYIHIKLFIPLIEYFNYNINYDFFLKIDLFNIPLSSLYYLYQKSTKFEFLEIIVQRDPFIEKQLYMIYANKKGIYKKDIFRILMAYKCDWALYLAIKHNWIKIN